MRLGQFSDKTSPNSFKVNSVFSEPDFQLWTELRFNSNKNELNWDRVQVQSSVYWKFSVLWFREDTVVRCSLPVIVASWVGRGNNRYCYSFIA